MTSLRAVNPVDLASAVLKQFEEDIQKSYIAHLINDDTPIQPFYDTKHKRSRFTKYLYKYKGYVITLHLFKRVPRFYVEEIHNRVKGVVRLFNDTNFQKYRDIVVIPIAFRQPVFSNVALVTSDGEEDDNDIISWAYFCSIMEECQEKDMLDLFDRNQKYLHDREKIRNFLEQRKENKNLSTAMDKVALNRLKLLKSMQKFLGMTPKFISMVDELHSDGYRNLDIKLENILICSENAKVSDLVDMGNITKHFGDFTKAYMVTLDYKSNNNDLYAILNVLIAVQNFVCEDTFEIDKLHTKIETVYDRFNNLYKENKDKKNAIFTKMFETNRNVFLAFLQERLTRDSKKYKAFEILLEKDNTVLKELTASVLTEFCDAIEGDFQQEVEALRSKRGTYFLPSSKKSLLF